METFSLLLLIIPFLSSYPTYEEWKQLQAQTCLSLFQRSYPTYEEWKQDIHPLSSVDVLCSYPTYEEWKLYHITIRI